MKRVYRSLAAARRPLAAARRPVSERRGRDSNPRWSLPPHTRLAGECLQPLGHLSGAAQSRDSSKRSVLRQTTAQRFEATLPTTGAAGLLGGAGGNQRERPAGAQGLVIRAAGGGAPSTLPAPRRGGRAVECGGLENR